MYISKWTWSVILSIIVIWRRFYTINIVIEIWIYFWRYYSIFLLTFFCANFKELIFGKFIERTITTFIDIRHHYLQNTVWADRGNFYNVLSQLIVVILYWGRDIFRYMMLSKFLLHKFIVRIIIISDYVIRKILISIARSVLCQLYFNDTVWTDISHFEKWIFMEITTIFIKWASSIYINF